MAHQHCNCCSHEHEHHHEHEDHHEHDHHEHGHHHDHEHHHHHEEGGLKNQLTLIVVTAILLVVAVLIEHGHFSHLLPLTSHLSRVQLLLVYLVPYLLIGHETLHEAWEGIRHGDAFNEHFLMSVATIGALLIGFLPGAETQFPEAVFVMLFFQVGELFEGYAEGKSRDSIAHLMDIRPDVAHVEMRNEELEMRNDDYSQGGKEGLQGNQHSSSLISHSSFPLKDLPPEDVAVGSVIVVRPGEKVPLDGVVIEGASALNTVALTGESLPRDVAEGDEVISGCVNLSGLLRVRVTKPFGESTVTKIISLVEHASDHKSRSEAFITRFARIYTPIVVFMALAIAILPPLFISLTSYLSPLTTFPTWLYRALMFLVVSCPCALVISVPLTFFGGIGGASRKGILVKGANYMDVLANVRTVVFDKTGTLTHGHFAVTAVHPKRMENGELGMENGELRIENYDYSQGGNVSASKSNHNSPFSTLNSQLLHLAAHVEHFSTHPIGAALRDAFPDEATDGCRVTDVEEIAGQGIRARVEGRLVCVGNTKMMEAVGARCHDCPECSASHDTGTVIHIAIDGEYAGHIVISDRLKPDSREAIDSLRSLGVTKTVMLTGDRQAAAEHVASQLGITEYHAELLPADKVAYMERLKEGDSQMVNRKEGESQIVNSKSVNSKSLVAFVGDGINDAPVLARADVGIAMGGLGSDAAIEAADVVLMDDRLSKLPLAIRIARRTLAIARQNVAFAIGVKVAVLILAAFGLATMWLAVFADVGVTVLAVLNAMRALRA